MSLTLLANIKGELYMGADYRRSITIEGNHYAVANDSIKMIHNKEIRSFLELVNVICTQRHLTSWLR